MTWPVLALLSALFASLVAIFGKLGMKEVDALSATTIRSIIMSVALVCVFVFQFSQGKSHSFTSFNVDVWKFVVLSGLAGAASWICYFQALKIADASKVATLDRMSLLMTFLFAVIFLGEKLTWKLAAGAVLMIAGSFIVCL